MANSGESIGFLFIPDISGFTEFVNSVEISHSRHIISELLDIIIKSNDLGLKVAEIEGDAIFLYCESVPSFEEVMAVTKSTFINFHHHLKTYEKLRICQCGACKTANKLTLKFVAHADHFSFLNVSDYHKPYGSSVILIHKLLKNPIPVSEYLLISEELQTIWSPIIDARHLIPQEEFYEGIGRVSFFYLDISNYYDQVPSVEPYEVPQKSENPYRLQLLIYCPVEIVEIKIADLNYKLEWIPTIKEIKQQKPINILDNEHLCTIRNTEYSIRSIRSDFEEGFVYGERILNPPLVDSIDIYFILKESGKEITSLSFELHISPGRGVKKIFSPFVKLFFSIMYRNHIKRFKRLVEIESFKKE